ncbi:OpgC family protein [Ensifer soli]|uniref:OpgC family protein n=1 Tax=Ciceribacter sp. sgz301302 TaxID=3342379 RepID=UPI0035B91993
MAKERENRIDLLRGLSLLLIFVGHANFTFSEAFQQARGFSDASEIFVLLAGVSAALAYYRPREAGWQASRPLRRAGRLYVVHLAMFATMALVAGLALVKGGRLGDTVVQSLYIADFWKDPLGFGGRALALAYMPGNLDILPMYVVLIAAAPLIFRLHDRSKVALAAVSVTVWLVSGLGHINLPNAASENGRWYFDPLSWQIIFVAGIVIGIRMKTGLSVLPYNRLVFRAAAAFALAAIPVNLLFHFGLVEPPLPVLYDAMISKTNSGILRLMNMMAILYLAWNLPLVKQAAAHPALALVCAAGRHSLPVFVLGVALSELATIAMLSVPDLPIVSQLAMAILGCAVQLMLAQRLAEKRRQPAALPPQTDRDVLKARIARLHETRLRAPRPSPLEHRP